MSLAGGDALAERVVRVPLFQHFVGRGGQVEPLCTRLNFMVVCLLFLFSVNLRPLRSGGRRMRAAGSVERLHLDQLGVDAVAGHQLGVCALLGDAPVLDDRDFVRIADRGNRWAMTIEVRPSRECVQRVLHQLLALGVEGPRWPRRG